MIKILQLGDIAREPERRLLRGFMHYASGHGGCVFYPVSKFIADNPSKYEEIAKIALELKVDAIIGGWKGINTSKALTLGIPIFLRTTDTVFPEFPMLSGNYVEMGRMAGAYLTKNRYSSYGFIGFKNLIWSDERLKGFQEIASLKEVTVRPFYTTDAKEDWEKISSWLVSLPKPAAVLACNDVMARHICEICIDNGLELPYDISLLGMDDDEFLCNISYPGISSVRLDFERQGLDLAKSVFNMVESKRIYPARVMLQPIGITERASTLQHIIKDSYIKKLVGFIDSNYTDDISYADIISGIPLSPRSIELRFKKEFPEYTILSYLAFVRVKQMCILLTSTDLSVSQAAEKAGFTDILNVSRTFRKYCGMSPAEYKRKYSRISDDYKE